MVVQQAVIERKLHVKLSNEGAMSITITISTIKAKNQNNIAASL